MLLQALNRYYEILLDDPKTRIAPFGYSTVGVSFALNISAKGELLDVLPQFSQEQRGKKLVDVPQPMIVPQQIKRSVNIAPNFLWDNSVYVLGISEKDEDKPQYSLDRFAAFCEFHRQLLGEVQHPTAHALLAFVSKYHPAEGRSMPAIAAHLDTILKGGNLVFMLNGKYIHQDPVMRQVWQAYLSGQDSLVMQCLVTGEKSPIARLHPSLKRVRNAQSSGATLVGFNAAAYESYNRSQGLNSPISEKATFAYTTVLNYLLSDENPNKKFFMGDTTVVYWAESENRAFETAFASILDPSYIQDQAAADQEARRDAEAALKTVTEKVRQARMVDLDGLLTGHRGENPHFYILGLAPNAARVSVRFFISDRFESIIANIMTHYRDLEIVKEFPDQPDYLTVGRVLYETVSKKSSDKNAIPLLAGAVLRAILTNAPYPAALYYALINRIRADMDDSQRGIRKINYIRAAVIKAFLIRKYRHQAQHPFQEVLTMALNEQSTIPAYLLGRLFAVLEKAQQDAIGDVNAGIKDRYFTSACASPASVFPILLRLSQHHITKVKREHKRTFNYDRRIQDIMNLLDVEQNPIPARLTLDEQGIFVLGYYHQRAAFYAPRSVEVEMPVAKPVE